MRDLWFENNTDDENGEWDNEESEEEIEPVSKKMRHEVIDTDKDESGDSEDL